MDGFMQSVLKADIPENLLQYVRQDMLADRIHGDWTEIVGWGSCKLYARKQGAVIRYMRRHYGVYDCCHRERVLIEGHRLTGTFEEAPVWLLEIWRKVRGANPGIRFLEFKREHLGRAVVSLRDSEGNIWSFVAYKREMHLKNFAGLWPDMWFPIDVQGITRLDELDKMV